MAMSLVTSLALPILVGSLIGCGVRQKLDGMYDSTQHLAKSTDDLSNKQAELYDALRQGNALQARHDILNTLLASQDSGRKISEAAKYFSAFDFQLWSNLGLDTPQRRIDLETVAAREFMRDVQEFIKPGQTEPSPLAQGDPTKKTAAEANRQASLNALSVAMHLTNPKQDELVSAHPEFKAVTMYLMIQESLRAKPSIDCGAKKLDQFPGYVREILTFENVARLLVQTRFNFLGAMLLANTSTIREGDHTKLWLPYWANFEAGKMRFMSWNMDIANQGVAALEEDGLFMTGALKVAAFMKEVGMIPKLNSNLHGILAHAHYPEGVVQNVAKVHNFRSAGAEPAQVEPVARAQTDLVDAFETYRQY